MQLTTDLLYNMQKILASLNKTSGLEIRLLFCSSAIKIKKYSITCIYILAANQVTLPFEFCFPQNGPNPFPVWLPWLQHSCTRDDCSSLSLLNNSILNRDKKKMYLGKILFLLACWVVFFIDINWSWNRHYLLKKKRRKSIHFICFLAIVKK